MSAPANNNALIWLALGGGVVALWLMAAQRIRELAGTLGKDWTNLHPAVQVRALRVMDEVNAHPDVLARGLRLGIHDGWRESADQDKVINAGASQVSHPLNSYHRWGLAVDLVFIDKLGRWTWLERADKQLDPLWLLVGAAVKRQGFTWGADWDGDGNIAEHTLIDAPHAQLPLINVGTLRTTYKDNPDLYVATFPKLSGLDVLV